MINSQLSGSALTPDQKLLIMIHGRGEAASDILSLASELYLLDFTLIEPQAVSNSWYPKSFLSPRINNEPNLSASLLQIKDVVDELKREGLPTAQIYFLGFSQGACLMLDFAASNAERFGGIVAFTGGVIGQSVDHRLYHGDFKNTPVVIASSDPDEHVPVNRVRETTNLYENMGADVTEILYKNMGHTISDAEIYQVNKIIFGKPKAAE